jgi:hypothetical protein
MPSGPDGAIDRMRRRHALARETVITLICLIACGCAGLSPPDDSTPHVPSPSPEGKKLTELANAAFATTKLPGKPEVSPVRATHDAQWGDWMFCIKSDSAADSRKYAVLVGHDAVLEVRSMVMIDGCEQQAYHPLEPTTDQKGGRSRHR